MAEINFSSIDYHTPKTDLWAAFKKLKQVLEETKASQPEVLKVEGDWRQQLIKVVKQLDAQIQEKGEELDLLQDQIEKAKKELEETHHIKVKAQTFTELGEKINSLEALQQKRQKQLDDDYRQEKAWREKRLEKEDEEKKFELELQRRRLEQELEQKRKDWEKKERHYQELQEEVAKFPERLQKAEENAAKETAARLGKEFGHEKNILNQKHEADQKLMEQQIKNLQEKVKEQEEQVKALSAQLSDAHQRIKELAVAALEAKRPREEKATSSN